MHFPAVGPGKRPDKNRIGLGQEGLTISIAFSAWVRSLSTNARAERVWPREHQEIGDVWGLSEIRVRQPSARGSSGSDSFRLARLTSTSTTTNDAAPRPAASTPSATSYRWLENNNTPLKSCLLSLGKFTGRRMKLAPRGRRRS
jgi:hypothetical protein